MGAREGGRGEGGGLEEGRGGKDRRMGEREGGKNGREKKRTRYWRIFFCFSGFGFCFGFGVRNR